MFKVYKSLRGISGLLSLTKTSEDYASLFVLLQDLATDTAGTLMMEDTHQVKGTKNKLFQISVDSMRIIYFRDDNDIFIVHFCYKQKNKTPKSDVELADKRASKWKQLI